MSRRVRPRNQRQTRRHGPPPGRSPPASRGLPGVGNSPRTPETRPGLPLDYREAPIALAGLARAVFQSLYSDLSSSTVTPPWSSPESQRTISVL